MDRLDYDDDDFHHHVEAHYDTATVVAAVLLCVSIAAFVYFTWRAFA